ncbi:MAG: LacI family DNA-binding transcriptional regulator [Candidatus Omnitrophica bacterium]|nr:LacI family DNA-binding transcriptional regulator [Candidatus Omnitrophota bacterium]
MGPSKKKISIKDVARACGVSITTVSRVLNKSGPVSKASKARIEEAIKDLKFMPSAAARALARGEANAIGLVIPHYEGIFYSYYALEIIKGVGTMCDVMKFDLLLHITGSGSFLSTGSVAGVIFADVIKNRGQLESALKENIPAVVINNFVQDLAVSCIAIDNEKGAYTAVKYLIDLGHKKIAHITGDLITQAASERLKGYRRALEGGNIAYNEGYVIKADYSRGAARTAMEALLDLGHPPTAVFVASDSMALEAINVIYERKLDVPKDISIIGFDDDPSGLYGKVALTTVRQPFAAMAQEAVKELRKYISEGAARVKKVRLPVELVVRDSCRQIS